MLFAPFKLPRPSSGFEWIARRLLVGLAALAWAGAAAASDLNIAIDQSTEMPWAALDDSGLTGGIHFDFGQSLSAHLGRTAHFVVLSRKRIPSALTSGQVDIACAMLPEWLPGHYRWTQPFLWSADVVITARTAPQPSSVIELAGKPIGTVNGFAYPALERALGKDFVRDDAPNAGTNLRKLELGHLKHVVTNQRLLEYMQRQKAFQATIYPPLVLSRQELACALSPASAVPLKAVHDAIADLVRDGTVKRILGKYR